MYPFGEIVGPGPNLGVSVPPRRLTTTETRRTDRDQPPSSPKAGRQIPSLRPLEKFGNTNPQFKLMFVYFRSVLLYRGVSLLRKGRRDSGCIKRTDNKN